MLRQLIDPCLERHKDVRAQNCRNNWGICIRIYIYIDYIYTCIYKLYIYIHVWYVVMMQTCTSQLHEMAEPWNLGVFVLLPGNAVLSMHMFTLLCFTCIPLDVGVYISKLLRVVLHKIHRVVAFSEDPETRRNNGYRQECSSSLRGAASASSTASWCLLWICDLCAITYTNRTTVTVRIVAIIVALIVVMIVLISVLQKLGAAFPFEKSMWHGGATTSAKDGRGLTNRLDMMRRFWA